jgi:hypothetical protein
MATRPNQNIRIKKNHEIRLFSMIVFIAIIISSYKWINNYQTKIKDKSFFDL